MWISGVGPGLWIGHIRVEGAVQAVFAVFDEIAAVQHSAEAGGERQCRQRHNGEIRTSPGHGAYRQHHACEREAEMEHIGEPGQHQRRRIELPGGGHGGKQILVRMHGKRGEAMKGQIGPAAYSPPRSGPPDCFVAITDELPIG